jgi:hypothetical protein
MTAGSSSDSPSSSSSSSSLGSRGGDVLPVMTGTPLEAHYAGTEIRDIKGFKSKAEVDEWLQGSRRIDWLRSQGYAK